MSVDISNPSALSSSLNISQTGEIPVSGMQTWALSLHCGPYDAEVDLSLRVNVSLSKKNTTSLEFRRKKICLKEKSYTSPEEVLVAASGSTSGGQVFYAAVGCACAFIAAIFVLVVAYYVRDKKARRHRDPLQWVKRIAGRSPPRTESLWTRSKDLLSQLCEFQRIQGSELGVQRRKRYRSGTGANLFVAGNTATCVRCVGIHL